MPQPAGTFRIFVSSTFSDLKAERNALQERVFPRLRELCAAHGCRFQAIDLRWGVSEEASLDQQTMRICLGEIARCQQVTPRPNFIVLLGDRYGWRPLPEEIPAIEFEEIERRVTDDDIKALLTTWCRRDDNAVPPVHVLQPRMEEFEDYAVWETQVERPLRVALVQATAGMELTDEERLKYEASATHQEIVAGALQVEDAPEHVFCFFRTIEGLPENESAKDYLDLDAEGNPDEEARERQERLKGELRELLPGNVREYKAGWTGAGATTEHLDQMCEDVYQSLSRIILQQIAKLEAVDPLDAEVAAHETFGEERAQHFVGRAGMLRAIAQYVGGGNNHPLAVWGESGCGKSALLAKAVQEAHPGAEVVYRFVGATPDSSSGRALLEGLCREISQRYGADGGDIPGEYRELIVEFSKRLALATAERPLVLFLDALDQLSDADNARNLVWLPAELPEHVRLVVSSIPGGCKEALERRLPGENLVELKPMPPTEGERLLDLWLDEAGRTLQPDQRADLLDKFGQCGLPLYLKLAFEEARRWRSYDGLPVGADDQPGLSSDIAGVIRDLFWRLSQEANHGQMLVSRSLGYLAAAKNGLSEDEMLDVLSRDEEVMTSFRSRSPKSPEVERLPVVVWSRLHADLKPYLIERGADGTSLMRFYHPQLGEVVAVEYLGGEEKQARHRGLARTFWGQPLHTRKDEQEVPNLRKLSELPYQQTYGGLWGDLRDTLTDFDFLETKSRAISVYVLEADYRAALTQWQGSREDQEVLQAFEERLRLESHHINRAPELLLPQLYNHLTWLDAPDGPIHRVCEDNRGSRTGWLRAIRGPRPAPLPWSRSLEGHTGPVLAVAVTPDGMHVVSGSGDNTVKVWELTSGRLVRSLAGHGREVLAVAVTPGGTHIVSASLDGTVKVWELSSGRLLRSLEGRTGWGTALAVTPDGTQVCGSLGTTVKVWELASGQLVRSLEGHTSVVNAVAVTPDGTRVVSGSGFPDNTVKVWELTSGRLVRSLEGHTADVKAVAVTPDGAHAVSGSRDSTVKVWELATGRLVRSLEGHTEPVGTVVVTPDGIHVVSGSWGDKVKVWELASGRLVRSLEEHKGWGTALAVTPDGTHAASGCADHTVKVWELASGRLVRSLEGHEDVVNALAVMPDERHVASGSLGTTVKVWESTSGWLGPSLEGHTSVVSAVAVTPDGTHVISGSGDNKVKVWELTSGRLVRSLEGHMGRVTAVAVTPDGMHVVSGSGDNTVRVWELTSGRLVRSLEGHMGRVTAVAVTPDGTHIVSASRDRTVKVWELASGRLLRSLEGRTGCSVSAVTLIKSVVYPQAALRRHTSVVSAVAVTPDGAHVVSGGDAVKVWELASGRLVRSLEGHTGWVSAVAVTPDGTHVVSGTGGLLFIDDTVKVWELSSGWLVCSLEGHTSVVSAVAVTPDGTHVVSASADYTVKVWNLDTGTSRELFNNDSGIHSLDLSSDGRWLACGDEMGRVWIFEWVK
jgi:WD40 repeat protein